MPQLTQYQKDYVLKNRGLNSSEYDIDEDYNIIPKEQDVIEQPSITPSQYGADKFPAITTTPKDSPLKTFGKNLLEDIPSAAAGGVGIAAGIGLAPASGGLSFLIPLLSGLGASYGAKRMQQAIEPEAWQKNVQESSAENPKSAIAGGLAAIPFGGFSPNPVNTVKAVGGLGKVLTGAETTLPEIQNLLNVGGGAAISGGINAAQQAVSTQPFSFTDVLKAAGEGALFNDPSRNPIGRKLFRHAPAQTIHDRLRGGLDQFPQSDVTDVESTVTPAAEPVVNGPSPADIAVQQSLKAFKEAQAELQKAHIDAQIEQVAQQTKDIQNAVKEHQVAHEEPKEFPVELLSEKSSIPSEEPPKDLPASELPKPNLTEVLMDYPRQPFDYKDSTPKPDVRVDNLRFSEPSKEVATSTEKEILSNEKIPLNANEKWYSGVIDFLRSKGLEVSDNNQLINKKTGEPVAGKTTIDGNGVASLIETNPLKRGADTHMHEGFHAFVNALRHSERPADKRMIREYDRLTNESPDYQQWKVLRDEKNLSSTPEEYQATNEGYQFIKRHLNLDNESPLKGWYNDFKTYLKTRFTKHGTVEDYQRLLDYNLTHGRKTFSEIAGGLPPSHASIATTSQLSDESKIPSQEKEKLVEPPAINPRFAESKIENAMLYIDRSEPKYKDAERIKNELLNEIPDHSAYSNLRNKIESIDSSKLDDWKSLQGLHGETFKQASDKYNQEVGRKMSHAEDLQRYKEIHQEMMDNMRKGVFPSEQQKLEMENIKNRHGGMAPKEELLSEKSKLTSADHKTVKDLIDGVAANPELKDVEGNEARNALLKQVNWKDMPSVKTYLLSKLFDHKAQESWQYLKNLYDKYLEKPTTAKAIETLGKPAETPKQNDIKPEPIKAIEPAKPKEPSIIPAKPIEAPAKKVQASEFEELSKEDLIKEKKLAEYDFYKIDNTKKPRTLLAEFRERYRKALEEKAYREQEGFQRTSSTMQLLERRIRGLKTKYETLIDLRKMTGEPPIDIEKGGFYSEESKIPSNNNELQKKKLRYMELYDEMHKPIQDKAEALSYKGFKDSPDTIVAAITAARHVGVEETNPQGFRGKLGGVEFTSHSDFFRKVYRSYKSKFPNEVKEIEDLLANESPEKIALGEKINEIEKQQEANLFSDSHYSDTSAIPSVLRSEVQRVRDHEHPDSDILANAMEHFYEKRREHTGAITNDLMSKLLPTIGKLDIKGQFFQDTPEMQNVRQYRNEIRDHGTSAITLNAKEQKIEDIINSHLVDAQTLSKAHGLSQHIDMTEPGWLPDTASRKAIDTLTKHQGSPEYQQLMKDWNDYYRNVLGKGPKETSDAFNQFIGTYKKDNAKLASHYGPLDNKESTRLPESFREKSLVDLMARFDSRVGRRLAYKSELQDNPAAMHLLNHPTQGLGTNKHVKNVLEDIQGVREPEEAFRTALGGFVRAAMLGPLTGAKDLVSNFTLGMQHQTIPQSVITPLKALADISTNIKESFKAGVNRYNISALEMGDNVDVSNTIRRIRDVVSMAQGRNFLEKVTRGIAYGQGKLIAMDNLWNVHKSTPSGATGIVAGNKTSIKFLEDFGPSNWKSYIPTGQFPPDVLMKVAAKYVESVQGTYDLRGLPAIATKGSLAPWLSLSKWNIEKLNNFDKHVIQPLRAGNLTPLLMSTIGMVIGGEAVNQLVEAVTKRKEKTPNYKELQAIYEEPEGKFSEALLYKLAGLASYSGYAGIMGDLAKAGMDKWFKNNVQGYNNPLISGASTLGEDVVDGVMAFKEGNMDIGADILSKVMEDFFQSYRIALANLSSEKIKQNEKSDKLRDLKLFKTTTGGEVADTTEDRPNPFLNKDIKKFKQTDDMGEAVSMLPELISKAFEKADGNIDKLHSELAKIKGNNYQTMPSPEHMPQSFLRYMNRLSQTQGPDAASERFMDYMLQNAKNSAKSSMVPSL